MDTFLVVVDGKPKGPFSVAQLKEIAITPNTFVKKTGMDDFKEAHELPELRLLLGFAYQQTAPQYFAGFDQRLLASAIDYFLITLFGIFLVLIVSQGDKMLILKYGIGYAVASPLIKMVYGCIAESGRQQATIGKKLMDIRVGDALGNRISFSTAFLRNMAKIISTLPLFMGYLYLFINKKQQCLHDVMAHTVVVKKRLL